MNFDMTKGHGPLFTKPVPTITWERGEPDLGLESRSLPFPAHTKGNTPQTWDLNGFEILG